MVVKECANGCGKPAVVGYKGCCSQTCREVVQEYITTSLASMSPETIEKLKQELLQKNPDPKLENILDGLIEQRKEEHQKMSWLFTRR